MEAFIIGIPDGAGIHFFAENQIIFLDIEPYDNKEHGLVLCVKPHREAKDFMKLSHQLYWCIPHPSNFLLGF